jgi:SAM-dependent methyltransferase
VSVGSRTLLLEWQPHRLFPYERRLAAQEVRVLLGEEPHVGSAAVQVPLNGHPRELFRRFTYFQHVDFPDGERVETDQWRLERADATRRAQSTRYSAHGLHEYKGKFNPQVVRAIGNVLGLEPGATILDPFCGSGTTLLECAHNGRDGVGVDLNPLAVFIANAKLAAIHAPPASLAAATQQLLEELEAVARGLEYDTAWSEQAIRRLVGANWQERVPNFDYLSAWFMPSALAQFVRIFDAIDAQVPSRLRPVFLTIASDLVREASLQDPGDLRIRRRKDAHENSPVLPLFVKAVRQRVRRVLRARRELGRIEGRQRALEADNRSSLVQQLERAGFSAGAIDAAITSPPYATALPYIDTQRLSLCLLGLIDSSSIGARDRDLTGGREVGTRERAGLEAELLADETLPAVIRTLCIDLLERASAETGFRRRNVPSLAYRYFRNMQAAFDATHAALAPGAPLALVVGRNRTTLGGTKIVIDTPRLLAELGASVGFEFAELLELDAYQRFDMHQRNSITSEWLVVLRRIQSGP